MALLIAGSGRASAIFSMEPDWTYKVSGVPTFLRIEPLLLNEDAFPDLVVGNESKDNLTVFYGVGDGSFTLGEEYSINNICWIESADIDNDGDVDVLARTLGTQPDTIAVLLNNGTGQLEYPVKFQGPGGLWQGMFSILDINNDSNLDLITIWPFERVYAMFGDGVGGFTSVLLFSDEDMSYEGFNCADIDMDGDIDIVIICWGKFSVLLNDGNGSFTWNGYCGDFSNEAAFGTLGFGYLDGDAYLDIASAPGATMGEYTFYSFRGDGSGGFTFLNCWVDLGFPMMQTDVSDYNLDGLNDAFFTGYTGNVLMLGDGTGSLSIDYFNCDTSQAYQAAVADLDLDGDIDFVTAAGLFSSNFYMKVFLNKTIQNGIGDTGSGSVNGSLLLEISENPTSASSEVHFFLPVSSSSSIIVYDIHGREVDVLLEGNLSSGDHSVVWDAADYPPGCYTLVLRTETASIYRRCIRI